MDLSNVENILKKYNTKLERAFDENEESLTAEARDSKSKGIDLPDLSRYYVVYTDDKEKAEKLTQELSREESIESTEVIPSPVQASANLTG